MMDRMAQPVSSTSWYQLSAKDAPSGFEFPAQQWFSHVFTPALISTHNLLYHLQTIWLFTYTDLKTIVFPSSAFGVLTALSSSMIRIIPLTPSPIFQRLLAVFFWTWLNLLPFCIGNQRQAGAVIEDKQNKPWRPVASGRLKPRQAINLQLSVYPLVLLVSAFIGGNATKPYPYHPGVLVQRP